MIWLCLAQHICQKRDPWIMPDNHQNIATLLANMAQHGIWGREIQSVFKPSCGFFGKFPCSDLKGFTGAGRR